MTKLPYALLIAATLGSPCWAVKQMAFGDIDQYAGRAAGIWIVEPTKLGRVTEYGNEYVVRILKTLKGTEKPENIISTMRRLHVGERYLVFGFSKIGDSWLDNGNTTPIPIAPSLSLEPIEGSQLPEQLTFIITARIKDIDSEAKDSASERNYLQSGLSSHACEETIKSSVLREHNKSWENQMYLCGMIAFQKGDYDKARLDWTEVVNVNPANFDAKSGIERIDIMRKGP